MSYTGKVVWFNAKGIGFIKDDNDGEDYFIHYSNIIAEGFKMLYPYDRVEFDLGENHKGVQAINCRVVEVK